MLETVLTQIGYSAEREPRIPTVKGTTIPDLCAWNGELYIVCDVAMVSDNMDLDRVHQFKTNKYNITDIHRWMRQNNPSQDSGQMEAIATAFIINWCNPIGDNNNNNNNNKIIIMTMISIILKNNNNDDGDSI